MRCDAATGAGRASLDERKRLGQVAADAGFSKRSGGFGSPRLSEIPLMNSPGGDQTPDAQGTASRATVAFVAPGRPPTSNKNLKKHGERAKIEYSKLYDMAGGLKSDELSYAAVYYFVPGYRPSNDADAGNVHKRVLDGLTGVAYEDDHVVRLVMAGVIDYGPTAAGPLRVDELDLTGVPPHALAALATAIASAKDHFLYVEIGPLRPEMMKFGIGDSR